MKKFIRVAGFVALLLFVLIGIGIGILVYNGRGLDAESKAFVDGAIPAITSSWSEQALLARASPELKSAVNQDQLDTIFRNLSRLGGLVEYGGATGSTFAKYMIGSGTTISARYLAKAKFKNGEATFTLILLKRDGQWAIANFHVDPLMTGRAEQPA